jgi:predicted nucleic acid-binding protein
MNGIKFLLDTNVIIGLYERNPDILELLKTKQVAINACAYSAVTRMELLSYPALTPIDKLAIESLLIQIKGGELISPHPTLSLWRGLFF